MDLSYKRSVTIMKKEGENKWGEPIYSDQKVFDNVTLENSPLFVTVGKKRLVKDRVILTIYGQNTSDLFSNEEVWLEAKVLDENHNALYISQVNLIKNNEGVAIKCQLILVGRGD